MNNLLKKPLLWVVVVIIIIGGIILISRREVDDNDFVEGDVAIRINDTEFSYEEFDGIAEQVAMELQMYGAQPTKEQIKEQTVEMIIQQVLLIEHAGKKGVGVTQEEVDQKFNEFMTMYGLEDEDEFLAQLESQGIKSRSEVEEILGTEIKIEKLIAIYAEEIEITEEDLREAYEIQAEQAESMEQELPSFEEMEGEIRELLVQEQVTPLLLSKLEELRNEAEIEIFVDTEDIEEVVPQEGMEIDPGDFEAEF